MSVYKNEKTDIPVRDRILVCKDVAAELLSMSVSKLERLMKESSLPFKKIGGRVLFSPDELRNWVMSYGITTGDQRTGNQLYGNGGQHVS